MLSSRDSARQAYPRGCAFDSQFNEVDDLHAYPKGCAFDSQFSEIDDLLDAKNKLAHVHTLAASDTVIMDDGSTTSSRGRFTCSSKRLSSSSTACASSKTGRSSSIAVSDIYDEDGRPHAHVVARWMESMRPSGRSVAKVTSRGVDCQLSVGGRFYEWVIFL